MYILIYLGTPFIYSPGIPILPLFAGGIVLIIEAVMVIHITLLRREDIDLMLPWLVFDGFVLLSACATSIGRLQIGLFYAMSSRYTAFSNLFFLSFLVTAQRWAIAYVETNKYYTKKMPALKAVFLLILVMAFMLSSVFGGFGMAVDSQRRNECWQALQMYPNTPYIYLQQVSVLQSNVSSTRARVETLSRLGIIIPKSVSIKAREKQNRVDQKLSQINEALRLEPQNPDLYIKLVVAYSNNQNIEQAIQAYQLALRIDPGSFQKLYKIALIDADDKRLDEAINLLQMLSEIKPNDPAVDYKIACFYSRQSKTEEATIFLKNAVMKGFNDWGNLQTDPDLENTRNTSYYKKLINNINSISTPSSIFSINKNIEYMKSLFLRLKLIVHR